MQKKQLSSPIISSIHLVTRVATTISVDYSITLFQRFIWFETLQYDWPTPFWHYMTEKQTNRFTDFTFG